MERNVEEEGVAVVEVMVGGEGGGRAHRRGRQRRGGGGDAPIGSGRASHSDRSHRSLTVVD